MSTNLNWACSKNSYWANYLQLKWCTASSRWELFSNNWTILDIHPLSKASLVSLFYLRWFGAIDMQAAFGTELIQLDCNQYSSQRYISGFVVNTWYWHRSSSPPSLSGQLSRRNSWIAIRLLLPENLLFCALGAPWVRSCWLRQGCEVKTREARIMPADLGYISSRYQTVIEILRSSSKP